MTQHDGITHNWHFARDFPQELPDQVQRPHLLETITEILRADTPIVFLEGEEGDGATTTLAQFCRAYPEHTFALFVRPASKFAYSLDYLRLALAEQMHWYVHGTVLNRDNFDESEFDQLVLKIQRKQRSATLYFVVDGFHQIPAEDQGVIEQIFQEVLPIGVGQCRFLITGQQSILGPKLKGGIKSKPYQQLRFKPEETRSYMAKTELGEEDVSSVHALCKGIPGRLAAVRRLILAGTSLSTIVNSHPSKYLEFLKLEFIVLEGFEPMQQRVVATLAFSKMALSIREISEILGLESSATNEIVREAPFLTVNSNSGCVEFISESHRRLAEKQLTAHRKLVLDAQLAHLLKNPRSDVSLRFLPTYYETLNHQSAIISLISKEHYSDLLDSTQSFSALKNRAATGARHALALAKTHEVFKFSLHKSIFISAGELEASGAQIEALVALGKSGAALAFANRTAAKEDRLALLAAYARGVIEAAGQLEPEIVAFVKKLIGEVDCGELGGRAIEIAANVLIFDADAALGMIEKAFKGASAAAKDAAYAQLSLAASVSNIKHKTTIEDKARPKISSESLRKLATSFEIFAHNLDLITLFDLVAKMPASHQIYFLGSVVKVRIHDPRILEIVDFGLDVIIRESEYVPRSRDLAALAAPLAMKNEAHQVLRRVVARFDSQLGLIAKSAYSKDLAILQMRLAAAEYQYDIAASRDRVEQAYFEVVEIKTPEVQLECYALMLAALNDLDVENKLEVGDGFRALIRSDLDQLLERILADTGDNLAAITPVLKVIARDGSKKAIELAARLNTEERRDTAYGRVARVVASLPFSEAHFTYLSSALAAIANRAKRSQATVTVLEVIEANSSRGQWGARLEALRGYVLDPYLLCKWDIALWKIADVERSFEFTLDILVSRIGASIEQLESRLDEVDIRFRVAKVLARTEPIAAKRFYDEAEALKSGLSINSNSASELYCLCLSLLARAIAHLARGDRLAEDTLMRFCSLVSLLPDTLRQVCAYTDLAERFWCAKRRDLWFLVVLCGT